MSVLLCALCLAIVASHAEVVNFLFQGNPDFDVFVDGTRPITATGVTGTANGDPFTFDLTVSAVSGNGDGYIDFNKRDILLDADSGQNKANSLTLTISNMHLVASGAGILFIRQEAHTL